MIIAMKKTIAALLAVGAVLAGLTLVATNAAVPAAQAATAAPVVHSQIVTVQAASSRSTSARVDLWSRRADGSYAHVWGPAIAYIGANGVGATREGASRTPAGVFGLTQAFGNRPNNGTRLPYFQAGPRDWWDENPSSRTYNTHVVRSSSPGGESENLYYAGGVYAHAVNIDYNLGRVPGAGSAFFLHVTNGHPTAGCVALPSAQLDQVMRWLNPAAHPLISIGAGAAATAVITQANAAAAARARAAAAALKARAAHNPTGHLDIAAGTTDGVVVAGWAMDPDNRSARLNVDLYVDGHMRLRTYTWVLRADVARIRHTGPAQGFSATVPGVTPGRHTVCAYALNIGTGTGNPSVGCAAFVVIPGVRVSVATPGAR